MDPVPILIGFLAVLGAVSGAMSALWQERKRNNEVRRRQSIDPKRVLELRLARGEIDEEDFSRRMALLTYGPPLLLDPPARAELRELSSD